MSHSKYALRRQRLSGGGNGALLSSQRSVDSNGGAQAALLSSTSSDLTPEVATLVRATALHLADCIAYNMAC